MSMKEDDWTTEEKLICMQFKKLYTEDSVTAPQPDLTFMTEDAGSGLRKYRYEKLTKIAAIIMLMAASSLITAVCITNGYVDAFKDTVDKKLFKMNSSVVVTEGEISDEETEIWEITDHELLPDLTETFDGLKLPAYIPEGYDFEKAVIEQYPDVNYTATFSYKNDGDELSIIQTPLSEGSDVSSSSNGEIIELEDRTIFMWDDPLSDMNGCTVVFEDVMIQASSESVSLDEIREIAMDMGR